MRYGYRRVHVHLRRDGWKINMKKTRRIYSELGLQLRNKHPKRRVKAKLRDDRQEAVGPNDVWAMDFVHDQLAPQEAAYPDRGRHALAYCPAADARFTYRGEDVVQTLEGICRKTGYPKTIRVDNAASSSPVILTSGPMQQRHPGLLTPGKPTDNASSRPSTASCDRNA